MPSLSDNVVSSNSIYNPDGSAFRPYGVIPSYAAVTSLAASTTYYMGAYFNQALTTSATSRRTPIPVSTQIVAFSINAVAAIASSAGNVTVYVRVNNTTDYLLTSSLDLSLTPTTAVGTLATPISITAGDYFEIKVVTPAWATGTTNTSMNVSLYFK